MISELKHFVMAHKVLISPILLNNKKYALEVGPFASVIVMIAPGSWTL